MSEFKKKLEKWIEQNWGERCVDFENDCALCTAWQCFDFLVDTKDIPAAKRKQMKGDAGVKFKIFDNRVNPDESFVKCLSCGEKACFTDAVDFTIRAPRKSSDLVKDL